VLFFAVSHSVSWAGQMLNVLLGRLLCSGVFKTKMQVKSLS